MDNARQWGLPEGFTPLRFPITDGVKSAARAVLQAGEAVILTIANESGTVSIVTTTQRLLVVKSGEVGAGATGMQTKAYPWEGITNLVLQPGSMNVVFQIHYKTIGGGKVEIGNRAKMGKAAVDKVMPFDTQNGTSAFQALHAVWTHKQNFPDATT